MHVCAVWLTVQFGLTALLRAIYDGNMAAVELMVGRGADMEAQNDVRYVALRLVEVCTSGSLHQDWPKIRLAESGMHRPVRARASHCCVTVMYRRREGRPHTM